MYRRGKTTDALMRHIREDHNINISGSKSKKDLEKMGYFHGYKAYRFLRHKNDIFDFRDFSEIKSVYDFDTEMKSIFYPMVMQLETILKNYTISEIVSNDHTDINYIFKNYLNNDLELKNNNDKYKKSISRKLKLRMKINSSIFYNYSSSTMLQHYLNNSEQVPLWALFENMTLGNYGTFIQCLNSETRIRIEEKLGTKDIVNDTDGSHLSKHIFIIKDLRNAIAHNSVVFDCRFRNFKISSSIKRTLGEKTNINNMDFNSIIDYLILIIFYYKKLETQKTIMKRNVTNFNNSIENLEKNVSYSIYQKILGSDIKVKCSQLMKYVKSN